MKSPCRAARRRPRTRPSRSRCAGMLARPACAHAATSRWLPWSRMTALGKLFNTTAFKLTLVYLTVFALFAAFLLGYFAWNTRRLITEQITRTVDAEITGLSEQYNQGGIRRLVFIIDARARRPGSSLYLVTTFTGDGLAGNVGLLGEGVLEQSGWTETVYRRLDDPEGTEHHALVRVFQLPSGFRLLVGRDLEERERLYDIILAAGQWSIALVIVLGLAGGFFVARRVLHRVDAMTETSRTIMAGDLSGPAADRRLRRRARSARGQSQRHAGADRGADAGLQGGLRQHRPRSQDAAHPAAQPRRGGAARRQGRERLSRGARGDDRGIRRADPHLQRAADDRARGIGPGQHADDRVRRRRDRARRRRALRSAGGREGPDAQGRGGRRRRRCAATASW